MRHMGEIIMRKIFGTTSTNADNTDARKMAVNKSMSALFFKMPWKLS